MPTEAVQQVRQHMEAAQEAFALRADLPIAQRLVLEAHGIMLRNLPDPPRWHGDYRTSPVWVGERDANPDTADYVAPLPDQVPELMADWERFVNADGRHYPPLIQAALMLYQFETVHPFIVGNGRIGRLLVGVLLADRGRLSAPILELSGSIASQPSSYHVRLQTVRERGDIEPWVLYFLDAVTGGARKAVDERLGGGTRSAHNTFRREDD